MSKNYTVQSVLGQLKRQFNTDIEINTNSQIIEIKDTAIFGNRTLGKFDFLKGKGFTVFKITKKNRILI